MSYEEKYKEALKRADSLTEKYGGRDFAEYVFPELAESEDERMVNALISYFEWYERSNPTITGIPVTIDGFSVRDVIAWLEKQKEQKPAEWSDYKDKVNVPYCSSEPEWSEEQDYSDLSDLERAIHRGFLCAGVKSVSRDIIEDTAKEVLVYAKKQLLSYADESNPAIEAMADLERTFECNPDKLPLWLNNKLDKIRLDAEAKGYKIGYDKGYKVATKLCNESVAYYSPIMPAINIPTWAPPCYNGGPCTNPQMDCINCPRKTTGGGFSTSSGTSTATLHGNTSATDGKEHNPSFTD